MEDLIMVKWCLFGIVRVYEIIIKVTIFLDHIFLLKINGIKELEEAICQIISLWLKTAKYDID